MSKVYRWNEDKNRTLEAERGITFERVYFCITGDGLLDTIQHPNSERYPNQRIFIVNIEQYAYLVPFVEDEQEIFLKTIIPSRKMTRRYLSGD